MGLQPGLGAASVPEGAKRDRKAAGWQLSHHRGSWRQGPAERKAGQTAQEWRLGKKLSLEHRRKQLGLVVVVLLMLVCLLKSLGMLIPRATGSGMFRNDEQ